MLVPTQCTLMPRSFNRKLPLGDRSVVGTEMMSHDPSPARPRSAPSCANIPRMNGLGDRLAPLRPEIIGLHHIRIPVTDVLRSRDWYGEVLGFEPVLDLEEENRLLGTVMQHPSGIALGLHTDPARAIALQRFVVLSLYVGELPDLRAWARHLETQAIRHSAIEVGHLGWHLQLPDPDGILAELHTGGQPTADEA